jgi:hypothetical protein
MRNVTRTLVTALLGAAICAGISFAAFVAAALLDGTQPGEALGYGLIVGLAAAFLGALIGLAVGIGRLGVGGGAVVGLLATVAVVALYVLAFGRPGQLGYFLGEAKVFVALLALPTVLTGVLTARFKPARR